MIKRLVSLLLIFSLSLFLYSCKDKEDDNQMSDEPIFKTINVVTTEPKTNELLEIALFEKEAKILSEGNPYDYNYFKVLAKFTSPSGLIYEIPAFWYQGTNIILQPASGLSPNGISGVASTNPDEVQGKEIVRPVGNPHYRVRLMPKEVGEYNLTLSVYKNGKQISTEGSKKIEVTKGKESKGSVEVDPTNKRTFRYVDSLETFIPIGQNTGWYTSPTRQTEDYGVWFSNMAENDMNFARTWLATWGFCLHWGKDYNDFSTRYSAAARLDKFIEFAEEYDIYFMLCLLNHGQFSSTTNSEWDNNPWNKANGGPCNKPYDFFKLDVAKTAYKNELLYIIARYGYTDNLFSYELWNEVDYVDGESLFGSDFKKWHREMAEFIKSNDPYHHMVSTSYRGTDGKANSLAELDFLSPHDYSYSNKNWIRSIRNTQNTLSDKYDKPVFFGEIGFSGENGEQTRQQDPQGITLHQEAWAGMMSGAGGAMNWWWDSYVHPNNLYYRFNGAGKFSKLLDLTGSDYKKLEKDKESVSVSNSNLDIMGYRFNNRVYGYVFDSKWTYQNTSLVNKNNTTVVVPLTNGSYTLTIYDTASCNVIKNQNITVVDGLAKIVIDQVKTDIAFIIK